MGDCRDSKSNPDLVFALVVAKMDDTYLIVQERKHKQRWYLPAGRVEQGESFSKAAKRETFEETGIAVDLKGILRIEHSPASFGARMRVVYLAEPIGDPTPKVISDKHSLRAMWVTLQELSRFELRGREVQRLFKHVEQGGEIYPLGLLQPEGSPYRPKSKEDTWETD